MMVMLMRVMLVMMIMMVGCDDGLGRAIIVMVMRVRVIGMMMMIMWMGLLGQSHDYDDDQCFVHYFVRMVPILFSGKNRR